MPDRAPPPPAALPFLPKLSVLGYLAARFLRPLRSLPVLRFPAPPSAEEAKRRTLTYTYLGTENIRIADPAGAVMTIGKPVHFFCGADDEITEPLAVEMLVHWHVRAGVPRRCTVLPRARHFSVVPAAAVLLGRWLAELPATRVGALA